jgi:hypothetical protein
VPEVWVPGAAAPSIEDFVGRILKQIERFAKDSSGGEAQVEVELKNGSVFPLESIVPEPGYGFVTLRPHSSTPEEVVIPVDAIARISLGPPETHPPFGFSQPSA